MRYALRCTIWTVCSYLFLHISPVLASDEYPCEGVMADGKILISDLTKCLEKHFPGGVVEEVVLDVFLDPKDPASHVVFTFPTTSAAVTKFNSITSTTSSGGPKCTRLTEIKRLTVGSQIHVWCPNPGVLWQAWRDVFSIATGTPVYKSIYSRAFKCSDPVDLATMPEVVRLRVC